MDSGHGVGKQAVTGIIAHQTTKPTMGNGVSTSALSKMELAISGVKIVQFK